MIFSKHRKKLEPRRRFGSRSFRGKLAAARNYKRFFSAAGLGKHRDYGWRRWLGYGLLVIVIYFLVISDKLLISEITVSGHSQVSPDQVRAVIDQAGNRRLFLIKQNHYLLMTTGRVDRLLRESLSAIRRVVGTDRQWPRRIAIDIEERRPGFVLQQGTRLFLVDDEGVVVKEVPDVGSLPLVISQDSEEATVAGENLPNKLAAFVVSMHRAWPSKIETPLTLVKVTGKNSLEAQFDTSEGWSVFFDVTRPVKSQLANLSLIMDQPVKNSRSQLAYVDLRSSKWAYYCLRQTACSETAINPEESTHEE